VRKATPSKVVFVASNPCPALPLKAPPRTGPRCEFRIVKSVTELRAKKTPSRVFAAISVLSMVTLLAVMPRNWKPLAVFPPLASLGA
jgi:hypothetical protein